MKTKQTSLIRSILLVALLLAACAPASGVTISGGTRAWVDQPVTNALIPLAPFTIRGHASRPGGGIVKMSFMVDSTEVGAASTDDSADIVTGEAEWTPSAPGVYSIQVLALGADGITYSDAARVCVSALSDIQPLPGFLGDCGGSLPNLPPPTDTPTATPLGNLGTANTNANCHAGPGIIFPVLSYVPSGSSVEVTALSADGFWYQVKPCGLGSGWVSTGLLILNFDPAFLPVLAGPPTPTVPAPFDCAAAYGSVQVTCQADPRCDYVAKTCVNK